MLRVRSTLLAFLACWTLSLAGSRAALGTPLGDDDDAAAAAPPALAVGDAWRDRVEFAFTVRLAVTDTKNEWRLTASDSRRQAWMRRHVAIATSGGRLDATTVANEGERAERSFRVRKREWLGPRLGRIGLGGNMGGGGGPGSACGLVYMREPPTHLLVAPPLLQYPYLVRWDAEGAPSLRVLAGRRMEPSFAARRLEALRPRLPRRTAPRLVGFSAPTGALPTSLPSHTLISWLRLDGEPLQGRKPAAIVFTGTREGRREYSIVWSVNVLGERLKASARLAGTLSIEAKTGWPLSLRLSGAVLGVESFDDQEQRYEPESRDITSGTITLTRTWEYERPGAEPTGVSPALAGATRNALARVSLARLRTVLRQVVPASHPARTADTALLAWRSLTPLERERVRCWAHHEADAAERLRLAATDVSSAAGLREKAREFEREARRREQYAEALRRQVRADQARQHQEPGAHQEGADEEGATEEGADEEGATMPVRPAEPNTPGGATPAPAAPPENPPAENPPATKPPASEPEAAGTPDPPNDAKAELARWKRARQEAERIRDIPGRVLDPK